MVLQCHLLFSATVFLWPFFSLATLLIFQSLRFIRYHFATLYDTNHRIAVYSAYQFQPSNGGGRETRWFVEPQVGTTPLLLMQLLYLFCFRSLGVVRILCIMQIFYWRTSGCNAPSDTLCLYLMCVIACRHILAGRDEGWLLAGEGPPWGLPRRETGSE